MNETLDYYVTFGSKYRTKAHPTFPKAHPYGYIRVVAESVGQARAIAAMELGHNWEFIYGSLAELKPELYPLGELAVFDRGSLA